MSGGISILYAVLTGCIMLIFSFLPLPEHSIWHTKALRCKNLCCVFPLET